MDAFVIEQREVGTVTVTVVHLPEIGRYSVAVTDRFGIAGSFAVKGLPAPEFLDQAARHHVRISQSVTRRN